MSKVLVPVSQGGSPSSPLGERHVVAAHHFAAAMRRLVTLPPLRPGLRRSPLNMSTSRRWRHASNQIDRVTWSCLPQHPL
jgi:hypothetical protein